MQAQRWEGWVDPSGGVWRGGGLGSRPPPTLQAKLPRLPGKTLFCLPISGSLSDSWGSPKSRHVDTLSKALSAFGYSEAGNTASQLLAWLLGRHCSRTRPAPCLASGTGQVGGGEWKVEKPRFLGEQAASIPKRLVSCEFPEQFRQFLPSAHLPSFFHS